MVQARAIENLIYTVASQSLYGVEDGIGMIAGPEGILTENIGEAVLVAEIDFERQQWLRDQDEKIEMPKQYKVVPGLLRWQKARDVSQRIPLKWLDVFPVSMLPITVVGIQGTI